MVTLDGSDGVGNRGELMDIHYADKGYRRRCIWAMAGVVVLSAVLLWQLNAWLQDMASGLSGADPDTLRRWLRMLIAALAIGLATPAIALGVSLRRLGLASRLQGRFPPREFKTLRDVRILRDVPALQWARRVEVFGLATFGLAGVLVAWAFWALWHFR